MADIDKLEIQIEATSNEATQKITELCSALKTLKSTISSATSPLQEFNDTIKEVSNGAEEVTKSVVETSDGAKLVKKDAEEVGKSAVKAGKNVTSGFAKATQGIQKFAKSLGRIALYRLMRFIVSTITNGVKTGIDNLYQWSLNRSKKFSDAMDKMSTASQYLKNSLGAMLEPIIISLANWVDNLITRIVSLTNRLGELFAFVTGSSTYTKAVKIPSQFAEDTNKATGSVKELKRQLAGFDELNVLSLNNGSSSGSSSSTLDYDSMFETAKVSNGLADTFAGSLLMSIKDVAFDWKNVNGEQVAEKIFTGVCGLVGGIIGFALGGVAGAKLGAKVGVGIGLLISSLLVNHDGTLSKNELASILVTGLTGLVGGVIGFAIGGPGGALIGATLGMALGIGISKIFIKDENGNSPFSEFMATVKERLQGNAEKTDLKIGIKAYLETLPSKIFENFKTRWEAWKKDNEPTVSFFAKIGTTAQKLFKIFKGDWDLKDRIVEIKLKITSATLSGLVTQIKNYFKNNQISAKDVFSGLSVSNSKVKAEAKAGGGFVNTGQLFIAREAGPEMVGAIGGKTAVANNDQIVSAIAQGVYGAMMSANRGQNINISLEGDAKGLFKVVQKEANAFSYRTGASAFI